MPLFFIIFLILAIRVAMLPGSVKGYIFMFTPRWEALLNPMIWIWAMEPISKWGPWMDIVSIYIIPIGATLGAISWFYVMKKDILLSAINTGGRYIMPYAC